MKNTEIINQASERDDNKPKRKDYKPNANQTDRFLLELFVGERGQPHGVQRAFVERDVGLAFPLCAMAPLGGDTFLDRTLPGGGVGDKRQHGQQPMELLLTDRNAHSLQSTIQFGFGRWKRLLVLNHAKITRERMENTFGAAVFFEDPAHTGQIIKREVIGVVGVQIDEQILENDFFEGFAGAHNELGLPVLVGGGGRKLLNRQSKSHRAHRIRRIFVAYMQLTNNHLHGIQKIVSKE